MYTPTLQDFPLSSVRKHLHPFKRMALILLCLLLFTDVFGNVTTAIPPALAATFKPPQTKTAPNRYDPKQGTQSKNRPYTPGPPGPEKPHAPQLINHATAASMKAGTVDLQVGKSVSFLGSDGHLELIIPGDAITTDDLAQAGGKLSLQITQIAPASGSNAHGMRNEFSS